jgi:hypothetical protein
MTKTIYSINFAYTFDGTRKGAKYSFDGEHYKNTGEFLEFALKRILGYADWNVKDSHRFDKDSDITDLCCSIKSAESSLFNIRLADNFNDSLELYFAKAHSTMWKYVMLVDDTLVVYTMDKNEFREFVSLFSRWDNYKGKIKIKTDSKKLLFWLENNVVA